jgi:hypothetical protein
MQRWSGVLAAMVLAAVVLAGASAWGQAPSQPAPSQPAPAEPVTPPKGEVLFERHVETPDAGREQPKAVAAQTALPSGQALPPEVKAGAVAEISDAERGAIGFTGYDLDARLTPASGRLAMRARVTVRNDGKAALRRIALQISSTLTWESATEVTAAGRVKLALVQHLLDTDADHTGQASEVLLTLPEPLQPGASVTLDTLYSGTIGASAGRLERIGATPEQAAATDWDAIGAGAESSSAGMALGTIVALRGFGDVLWYPVAAPQLFLGDGNKLFEAIGRAKLLEREASVALKVSVEYKGEPPVAVYFCGQRQKLVALPDDPDGPVTSGAGIATAAFAAEPMGFRLPSLFVVERVETASPLVMVETADEGALPRLAVSAKAVEPLLVQWFGERPLSALTVLDHDGQPFEDGPLVVAPVGTLAASTSAAALAHSLTHAWVQTGQPWMDEGLAHFVGLLWTEQQQGREAALTQMEELLRPLVLAEPAVESASAAPVGQALAAAADEIYYRRKAAAVWWMLRDVAGEDALRQALGAWRTQAVSQDDAAKQAVKFERLLEKTSGKNLGWFFADWVLRDRGLPDLTIVDVTPRQLPAGAGHDTGWLVAVTVRNDGAAAVEVPLVVRSGSFSTTKRMRVDGFGSVTERVIVEAPPTEVLVNDGGTPEVRTSRHSVEVVAKAESKE